MNDLQVLDVKLNATKINATNLVIQNDSEYEYAVGMTRQIKTLQKEINETFDPIVEKAHEAHKEALAQKKKHTAPLLEAETIIKKKLVSYDTEKQKKIALEAERVMAENRKKLEEAQREKEEKAIEEALSYKDKEMQDMALDNAIEMPLVVDNLQDVPEYKKTEGISYRTIYKFEIVNINSIAREFLMPDEVKIGGVVRSMRQQAENIVGGIKVIEEKIPNISRY